MPNIFTEKEIFQAHTLHPRLTNGLKVSQQGSRIRLEIIGSQLDHQGKKLAVVLTQEEAIALLKSLAYEIYPTGRDMITLDMIG